MSTTIPSVDVEQLPEQPGPIQRKFIEACSDLNKFDEILCEDPSIRTERDERGNLLLYYLVDYRHTPTSLMLEDDLSGIGSNLSASSVIGYSLIISDDDYLPDDKKILRDKQQLALLKKYVVHMQLDEIIETILGLGGLFKGNAAASWSVGTPIDRQRVYVLLKKAHELNFDFTESGVLSRMVCADTMRENYQFSLHLDLAKLFKIAPNILKSDQEEAGKALLTALGACCIDVVKILLDNKIIPTTPDHIASIIRLIKKALPFLKCLLNRLASNSFPPGVTRERTEQILETWCRVTVRLGRIMLSIPMRGVTTAVKNMLGSVNEALTSNEVSQSSPLILAAITESIHYHEQLEVMEKYNVTSDIVEGLTSEVCKRLLLPINTLTPGEVQGLELPEQLEVMEKYHVTRDQVKNLHLEVCRYLLSDSRVLTPDQIQAKYGEAQANLIKAILETATDRAYRASFETQKRDMPLFERLRMFSPPPGLIELNASRHLQDRQVSEPSRLCQSRKL